MVSPSSISSYFFLLRNFRNAPELIQNIRKGGWMAGGPACAKAIRWDGKILKHPEDQGGLVGTLLETWHQRCYSQDGYYQYQPGDVIFDAGANIGLFSIASATDYPEAKILAFEPFPTTYQCLTDNLTEFGFRDRVNAINAGIGGSSGWAQGLNPTDKSTDARVEMINEEQNTQSQDAIRMLTLEDAMNDHGIEEIALLKMDIEGSEFPVFKSVTTEVLKRIRTLAIEYHDNLVDGTLELLTTRLEATHEIRILPEKFDDGSDRDYGILHARRH